MINGYSYLTSDPGPVGNFLCYHFGIWNNDICTKECMNSAGPNTNSLYSSDKVVDLNCIAHMDRSFEYEDQVGNKVFNDGL